MARFIQDPKTLKLIPAEEYHRGTSQGPLIAGDIESFVSPIDGSVITSRSQLREHQKRHGVTDSRDYSPQWFEQKNRERELRARGDHPQQRKERVEALQREFAKRGL